MNRQAPADPGQALAHERQSKVVTRAGELVRIKAAPIVGDDNPRQAGLSLEYNLDTVGAPMPADIGHRFLNDAQHLDLDAWLEGLFPQPGCDGQFDANTVMIPDVAAREIKINPTGRRCSGERTNSQRRVSTWSMMSR